MDDVPLMAVQKGHGNLLDILGTRDLIDRISILGLAYRSTFAKLHLDVEFLLVLIELEVLRDIR